MSEKKCWYNIAARADSPRHAEVSIHDEIGFWGIRFQDFARDLKALGELDSITVSLNSPGGEIFDGIALYNHLANHRAHITVRVEGIAASIASVIAMAGDDIQIPENAMIMVHNPWAITLGDAEEMRKMADVLDTMRTAILSAYRKKTGLEDAELIEMMDAETWMLGPAAIEKGFADTLLGSVHMANAVRAFDTQHPRRLHDTFIRPCHARPCCTSRAAPGSCATTGRARRRRAHPGSRSSARARGRAAAPGRSRRRRIHDAAHPQPLHRGHRPRCRPCECHRADHRAHHRSRPGPRPRHRTRSQAHRV
jgi:ATP-dependent protease ClpP protease subunit